MGDKRKLQAEIERCLKKVTEGVEAFDDIWKKVHSSNNTNQKEKFEADLKKEIKKLQRLRDQIKSWLVSGDVKDKQQLVENRKIIEAQMERFKVIERETKTKAFSKEGLIASGKVDPKEKEKEDITYWLSNSIEKLNVQIDKLESEIEALITKKKKLDKDEQAKHESWKELLSRHRYHINKLEAILRMVDNSVVQFEQIQNIRDDVEYYIASNQDVDFEENEFIYDELDLEDMASNIRTDATTSSPSESDMDVLGMGTAPSSNHSGSPSPCSGTSAHSKKCEEENKKKQKELEETSNNKNNLTVKTTLTESIVNAGIATNSNRMMVQTPTKSTTLNSIPSTPPTPGSAGNVRLMTTTSVPGLGYAQVAGSHHSSTPVAGKPIPTVAKSHPGGGTNGLIAIPANLLISMSPSPSNSAASGHSNSVSTTTAAAALSNDPPSFSLSSAASNSSSAVSVAAAAAPTHSPSLASGPASLSIPPSPLPPQLQLLLPPSQNLASSISQQQQQLRQQEALLQLGGDGDAKRVSNCISNNTHVLQSDQGFTPVHLKTMSQHVLDKKLTDLETDSNSMSQIQSQLVISDMSMSQQVASSVPSIEQQQQQQQQPPAPATHTIHLNPIYGVSPLGPQPLVPEQSGQQKMLENGFRHLPLPCDSESVRTYLPNNPCPTPLYYPQILPPIMQSQDYFNKLEPDSLFFIFYYMEGTKAQFLAAKALKQKSWRFHTKYMMWFQRHEEPKTITDEYEQGTYIYFDYEKWAQRKKEGFKFEYKFLEDQDLC